MIFPLLPTKYNELKPISNCKNLQTRAGMTWKAHDFNSVSGWDRYRERWQELGKEHQALPELLMCLLPVVVLAPETVPVRHKALRLVDWTDCIQALSVSFHLYHHKSKQLMCSFYKWEHRKKYTRCFCKTSISHTHTQRERQNWWHTWLSFVVFISCSIIDFSSFPDTVDTTTE